jgi:hypothetical protein
LALSSEVRSLLGLESQPAVVEQARLAVSAPVAPGTEARLWTAPSKSGGDCSFVTFGPPTDLERPTRIGGGGCGSGGTPQPTTYSVSITKRPHRPAGAAGWVPPLVQGRLDPNLRATRVEIHWHGGSKNLSFANGHFIGSTSALYQAPQALLPIRLIAYDETGRKVFENVLPVAWFHIN